MTAKVTLFDPIKIGDFNYLFFLVGMTDYDTDVREKVKNNIDAFGEDLGLAGNLVVPHESREQAAADQLIDKEWPEDIKERLTYEGDPFMLVIQTDFADFDPRKHTWSVIWFSEFEKSVDEITKLFHRLAVMAKKNEEIFTFLKKVVQQHRFKKWGKYFELKPGVFGCTIDAKAILADLAGS